MANIIDVRLTMFGPNLDVYEAKQALVKYLKERHYDGAEMNMMDNKVEWCRTWKWGVGEEVGSRVVAEFPKVLVFAYERDLQAPIEVYSAWVNIDGTPTRVFDVVDKETLARQMGLSAAGGGSDMSEEQHRDDLGVVVARRLD
jgi:hypothetical protein